jgi:hypothetical protein
MQSAQARSVVTVIIGCPLCAVCVVPFPKQVRVTYEPPTMNVSMYVTDIAECDGKQQGTVTITKNVYDDHVPFQLLSQCAAIRKSGLIFTHVYENDTDFLRMRHVTHPVIRTKRLFAWIKRNMATTSQVLLSV